MSGHRSLRWRPTWALLGALALLWRCGGDELDSISELNKYRVLAVRAEPPSLAFGEQSELRVFDFHPDDLSGTEPERSYRWRLCLQSAGAVTRYECLIPELDLEGTGATTTVDLLSLIAQLDQETRERLMSIGEEEVEGLEGPESPLGGGIDEAFDFSQGIPIYVKVTARAGDDQLEVVKQLRIRLDANTPDNENPEIRALVPTAPTRLIAGQSVELGVSLTEESVERYQVDGVEEEEEPFLSWASSGGKFERSITDTDPGRNLLTLPTEPGPLRVYVVARDRRGGVGIAELDLTVEASGESE